MSQMEKRTCIWDGCNETIELDISFENSNAGRFFGATVSGWCKLHSLAYNITCDLWQKQRKKKGEDWNDLKNRLYKTDRKRFNKINREIEKKAVAQAMRELQ